MITCAFNGRLGNNLFQIATVLQIAEELNVDVIFPETTWAGHRENLLVDLSIFEYDFKRGVIQTSNSYNENQFHHSPINPTDDLTLHGFFQSSKYFDSIKNQLINKYFTPSSQIIDHLSKYKISKNSLGISVRRGDYLMLQDNHCVLSPEYYQNALDLYFQDNIDQIFIFSDDIEWCKENLQIENATFADTGSDYVDLCVMSMCNHHIIANSSYSWWGAWLNPSETKRVIAPKILILLLQRLLILH
jgi:hypothetical protein